MSKSLTFSLIICTYKRATALLRLMQSVRIQTFYPDNILIVDGSENEATEDMLKTNNFSNIQYIKAKPEQLGLTKQRNLGVSLISNETEIVCFLDDDTILEPDYFEQLLATYQLYPEILGVGGYITNEVDWQPSEGNKAKNKFYFDGWMREEPLRFRVRGWFGLAPNTPPCFLPGFSHGRSVSFLPPNNQIYEVEHFMGGVSSYKTEIFNKVTFSSFFEGYGLYEDADFCFRILPYGKLYVNTAARLSHHHELLGRPNKYKYGKMVIRNGWYIWRVRYPNPSFKNVFKWHLTAILLLKLTFVSAFMGSKKTEAFMEGLGRLAGWCSLMFNKPKLQK